MPEERYSIFLSAGSPYNEIQEKFIAAIKAYLKQNRCDSRTVGQDYFNLDKPVKAARDLIGACDGTVVIAFERLRILKALDKPGSTQEKEVKLEAHPTIWNQMEAAMAYGQNVPIFTIVESGLRRQGMLSQHLEYNIIESELKSHLILSQEFVQIFADWLRRVQEQKLKRTENGLVTLQTKKHEDGSATPQTKRDLDGLAAAIDPDKMTFSDWLKILKPSHVRAIVAALVAVFVAVGTVGFYVGQQTRSQDAARH